jgi:hypothetical protein
MEFQEGIRAPALALSRIFSRACGGDAVPHNLDRVGGTA